MLGSFIVGLVIECILSLYVLIGGEFELVFKFSEVGDWVICDVVSSDVFSSEVIGVAALYSYGG